MKFALRNIFKRKKTEWLPALEGDCFVSDMYDNDDVNWIPVPGHEKYLVQNNVTGKVRSTGKEFDSNIDRGMNEESAAYFTMMWLKGYLSTNNVLTNNIDKIIATMLNSWKLRSIEFPNGKITVASIESQRKMWQNENVYAREVLLEKLEKRKSNG